MKYIALAGGMGVGKSTLAAELERRGYMILSTSRTIAAYIQKALQANGLDMSLEEVKADKFTTLRPLYQELPLAMIQYEPRRVVDDTLREWKDLGKPKAVFDSIRQHSETAWLEEEGFGTARIDVSPFAQYHRAMARGMTPEEYNKAKVHVTEILHVTNPSIILDGTRPTEEMAECLLNL